MIHFPKPTHRRAKKARFFVFLGLSALIPLAYLAANTALIPGLDPYFHPRATVDAQIIERGGRSLLWGGKGDDDWFDVTEFRLNPARLEYGLGREAIPAPIDPDFVSADAADAWLPDKARVLVAAVGDDVHVYPLDVMRTYEVVNDTLGGRPVFAAYCPLADLGAIYDRQYSGETYTFAVSGYTYYDWKIWRGYSAFVLWDRETESLWWPPLGKAVSGPSVDTPMRVLERSLWAQTTWGGVKQTFDRAQVLAIVQPVTPPDSWTKKQAPKAGATPDQDNDAVAPRWGRNSSID